MKPLLQFALRNLLTRPVRSFLALLGLTISIVGMVGLFSVAEGIEEMVGDTFARIPGIAIVQPGSPIPLFSKIPSKWADEIREIEGVHVVTPETWSRVQIIDGKPVISPPRFLFGTDIPSRMQLKYSVYRESLEKGRFLDERDEGTLSIVVSRQIAEEFRKTVGDTLRVDQNDMPIVGIYHCDSLLLDVAIIVDIERARAIARIGAESVCCFYVELVDRKEEDAVIKRIEDHFRGRKLDAWQPADLGALLGGTGGVAAAPDRGEGAGLLEAAAKLFNAIAPVEQATTDQELSSAEELSSTPAAVVETAQDDADSLPLEVRSSDDWSREFKHFTADLDLFLLIMTSIGVSIAVVSILNTMLMSVTERFIEFGILKANGWSKGDILKLIVLESAALGVLGGLCGSTLGWVATQVVNEIWEDRIHLYAGPGLLLFAVCFSTVLGIAGGAYPAYLAARMLPMDAIRKG